MMSAIRKALFWAHLGVAATGGIVVIIMAATGVLLTYQKQMTAWADRNAARVGPPHPGAARLGLEDLLSRAAAREAGTPTAVTIRSDPNAAVEIRFEGNSRQLVSAYTGEPALGEGTKMRAFFRKVTAWHRTLSATGDNREIAKRITGAANLGFLFLVLSGLYLWLPRAWSWMSLRQVTWFRRGLSPKARDFNWHNVIGFWTAVPLAIVVLGAVPISYRWAGNLVYRLAGDEPPAAAPRGGAGASDSKAERPAPEITGIDQLVATAAAREPEWRTLAVTLPVATARTASISVDRGMGGQPQLRSTLVLDRATGAVIRADSFASQSAGRRWRSILRFAHTGEILGPVGQTIAGLASLGTLFLAWTGAFLALRRFASWRRKRNRPDAPAARKFERPRSRVRSSRSKARQRA
jgi:uncharacterized iron-regulated membrane protein